MLGNKEEKKETGRTQKEKEKNHRQHLRRKQYARKSLGS